MSCSLFIHINIKFANRNLLPTYTLTVNAVMVECIKSCEFFASELYTKYSSKIKIITNFIWYLKPSAIVLYLYTIKKKKKCSTLNNYFCITSLIF